MSGRPANGAPLSSASWPRSVREVSAKLGNTPAICRKGYIHPQVQTRWLAGELDLAAHWPADEASGAHRLRPEEAAVLAFLEAAEGPRSAGHPAKRKEPPGPHSRDFPSAARRKAAGVTD